MTDSELLQLRTYIERRFHQKIIYSFLAVILFLIIWGIFIMLSLHKEGVLYLKLFKALLACSGVFMFWRTMDVIWASNEKDKQLEILKEPEITFKKIKTQKEFKWLS